MSSDQTNEPLKTRTGLLTAVFLVVILVGLGVAKVIQTRPGEAAVGGPMVGRQAPEVVAELFNGERWVLSEHLMAGNGPVLLNLFASWCAPCEVEIPRLSEFAARHPEINVVGVAVRDDAEAARRFSERLDPTYPTGVDATGRLRDAYIGFGMPALYLIDRSGIVVAQLEGGASTRQLESLLSDLG